LRKCLLSEGTQRVDGTIDPLMDCSHNHRTIEHLKSFFTVGLGWLWKCTINLGLDGLNTDLWNSTRTLQHQSTGVKTESMEPCTIGECIRKWQMSDNHSCYPGTNLHDGLVPSDLWTASPTVINIDAK
jgi:hypothetical protein